MAEIQSLARGLKILEILAESPKGVSVTELAEKLHLDKASASRLVSTLSNYGYAEKEPISRRYFLGPQVVSHSRSLLTRMPLREVAKPFLHRLMETTGECAHLGIFARGSVLYIDQVESPASLRVNAEVGLMAPLHCTALGKALMAFGRLPAPEALQKFTNNTIVTHDTLRKHLEKIREQGFAVDDEEYDLGVRCIAAPIFDFREKTIGSVGISGPITRVTKENIGKYSEQVLKISKSLSEKMHFSTEETQSGE